jgi:MFS family permease
MSAPTTPASPGLPLTASAEFRSRWPIVLVAAIGVGCGLSALPIYSLGALTKPLSAAMGWSRAETQGIYTAMTVGNLFAAPLLGWFLDRGGLRRVTLLSLVGLSVGMASLGWMSGSIWNFYAVAFVTSIIGVGTVPITWTRSVVDWFEAGRGRALGLALAGTGVAAVFIPSYTSWLIRDVGWRWAYVGLGALPAFLALPVSYFWLRDRRPAEAAPPAVGSASAAPAATVAAAFAARPGPGFAEVLRGYRFWLMAVVFLLIGAGIAALVADLIPLLTDRGVSGTAAAGVAGAIGFSVILGRIGTGFLIDRFWAPGVSAVILCLPAISCLILASGAGGIPAATLSAVLLGLAAGAEFDLMAFLVSRYFPAARYGIIYSCLYAIFKIGAGIGGPIFGLSFGRTGSYVSILNLTAAALVGGSLLLLGLGRYPRTERVAPPLATELTA